MGKYVFGHMLTATFHITVCLADNLHEFVCVEVLWPSQPNGVTSSMVSLSNPTFTGRLSPVSS